MTAFIDWRSQIANAGQSAEMRHDRQAQKTCDFVVKCLAENLGKSRGADIYQVRMRLYHGWYRGLTSTARRDALKRLLADNLLSSRALTCHFAWDAPFGDLLDGALDHRLHPRLNIHLPNTLRPDLDDPSRPEREKMVDTAIVCDVLCSARHDPSDWRIIMAEDDDLVPAAFVAERWGKERGGKTFVLRKRVETAHLRVDGLVWSL